MEVLPNFKLKVLNFNILSFIELGLDVWRYGSSQAVIISTACCCWVTLVVSDSVWPHRRQPTRMPRPWDSPGKNTGVVCHFLLQCMKVKSESKSLSRVRILATSWTAAFQTPPSMGFSRQEYWSGGPLPSPTACCRAGQSIKRWGVKVRNSDFIQKLIRPRRW